MTGERTGPRRRTVVTGALALLLAACTSGGGRAAGGTAAKGRPPTPDELAAGRAVLSARALLTRAEELATAAPALASLAGTIAADHRAHLAALGLPDAAAGSATASGPSPASPTTSGSPTPSGATASTSPAGRATAGARPDAASLVAAERAAAVEVLTDLVACTPATAGLLARIAGARAVHGDLLAAAAHLPAPGELDVPGAPSPSTGPTSTSPTPTGPAGTASPSPTATTSSATTLTGTTLTGTTSAPATSTAPPLDGASAAALASLLAGEHAAVFAYGLVSARIADNRQDAARTLWQAHRASRDELEERITQAGMTAPESEPAYDVGPLPTTQAQVVALAARVEDGMAAVAFGTVPTTTGTTRLEVALALVRAARRAASWRGSSPALPG